MTLNDPDVFDQALSRRLAQLNRMPVDTSALDRALRAQIPAVRTTAAPTRWRTLLRPVAAVAASLLFMVMLVLALQGRDAQASTAAMVQMHRDIVSGKVPTLKAETIEEANKAIAAFAGDFPALAEPPQAHTMACCMRNLGDKKVACVLMKADGIPVTMSIAAADAVATDGTTTLVRNGQTYHVQTLGELSMVMTDRGQHHVCVIAAMPTDKLVALVESIKF